jgi:hypothetical protein
LRENAEVVGHVIRIGQTCRAKGTVESVLERRRLGRHRLSCLEYIDALMRAESGDRVVKGK